MRCLQIKLADQILADDSHLPLFEVKLSTHYILCVHDPRPEQACTFILICSNT